MKEVHHNDAANPATITDSIDLITFVPPKPGTSERTDLRIVYKEYKHRDGDGRELAGLEFT